MTQQQTDLLIRGIMDLVAESWNVLCAKIQEHESEIFTRGYQRGYAEGYTKGYDLGLHQEPQSEKGDSQE